MNIKNQKHLICNDLIDIEKSDPNRLDIEKKKNLFLLIFIM